MTKHFGLKRVFYKEALTSLIKKKSIPFSYRLWAVLNGFEPVSGWFKKIDKHNKSSFLPDRDYYSHAPYNNPSYVKLIDKAHYRTTLCAFKEYLPKYYGMIEVGRLRILDSWPDDIPAEGANSIIILLKRVKILALKKVSGRAGIGFLVIHYSGGEGITINGKAYSNEDAVSFFSKLDGYIISEFIVQCEEYRRIWDGTTHTLRIQTENFTTGKARAVFANIRFGSSKLPYAVSHITSSGSFTALIDLSDGHTIKTVTAGKDLHSVEIRNHPETGVDMYLSVPHWNEILSQCLNMHDSIPELSWLGWDIVVTDDGFRVLEVNTFPGILGQELITPVRESKESSELFDQLMKLNEQWTR